MALNRSLKKLKAWLLGWIVTTFWRKILPVVGVSPGTI